ncbi:AraC family transcriptional regulator [Bacillus safensis]|uniref:helix-turn-helix domain-containing protein n=1 Tax=Bacillus safensis TaxID=561879 RepID=UPI0030006E3D
MGEFIYKKVANITALSASLGDFQYKNHAHMEYAIGVTLRGIQHYHLEGKLQLSHPGGVMLFNPDQAHNGMAHNEEGLDYVMIYIDPKVFAEVSEKKDNIYFDTPIMYDQRLKQSVVHLAQAILNEQDEALCSELLLSLADILIETNPSSILQNDNTLITKAKEMLYDDLGSVPKLEEISKELNLSKFQLIRLFKSQTGITPYQYFLNCKIERAKKLIDKNKDIYAAVAECNFVDLTHLNKHFKKMYGITAFEYMKYVS